MNLADSQDRAAFQTIMKMKEEPMDVESVDSNKEEEEIDMELSGVSSDESIPKEPPKKENLDPRQNINTLLQRQAKFLESCREVKTVVSKCPVPAVPHLHRPGPRLLGGLFSTDLENSLRQTTTDVRRRADTVYV
ncbi:transformation/transcription domain-associated protein-like [Pecten maximus]|uniref:transformation/transcription domain-associated protein-like n=1 Tax=Pecten maximus TaxID=6579 RepID=UPI001457EFF3|nr:transformation/transcription domain-associated protein-like [Pecten maximus]